MRLIQTGLSLLLIFLLLAGCAAPADTDPPAAGDAPQDAARPTTSQGTFSLPYSSTDSLDPYTAATKCNQELCQLLYDSLMVLDENFQPVPRLAETVTQEGTRMTVRLKEARFSDGTPVTAGDVVYSISLAKGAATRYAAQLAEISGYTAADSRTLSLTLSRQDPFARNLLDFPILKQGTVGRTNGDGKAVPPVGSGRYVFQGETPCLRANADYEGGPLPLEQIQLVETPDEESLRHNIEIGNISFAYTDMSRNATLTMTGVSQRVDVNQLIFLGVNFANSYLGDTRFRQALSLALNRTAVAADAYYSYADPAYTPFPDAWARQNSLSELYCTENRQEAVGIWEDLGYTTNEQGVRCNTAGRPITLTLLVNEGNTARAAAAQCVANQLRSVGLQVSVRTLSWAAYNAALAAGQFDLYLGEARLTGNMDFSALVTPGSGACFGYIQPGVPAGPTASGAASGTNSAAATSSTTTSSAAASSTAAVSSATASSATASSGDPAGAPLPETVITPTAEVYAKYYSGEATLSDLLAAFRTELPILPLCRHYGQICYDSRLAVSPGSTLSDLFLHIQNIAFYESDP